MPAFVETYSADMRAALFSATIDRKMAVAAALRAAKAGELPDLGAEDQTILAGMAYNHAAKIVKDERLSRAGIQATRRDTTTAGRELAARLLALADREVRLLEAVSPKKPVDTGRAIAAGKLMREAIAVANALATPTSSSAGKDEAPAKAPSKPKGLAARIAAASGAEHDDLTTEADATRAAATGAQASERDGQHDGPVRLRVASRADSAAGSPAC